MKCPYCNLDTVDKTLHLSCKDNSHWFVFTKGKPNYWFLHIDNLPIFNQIGRGASGFYIKHLMAEFITKLEKIDIKKSKEILIKYNKLKAFI